MCRGGRKNGWKRCGAAWGARCAAEDFADDRLGLVLEALSEDQRWAALSGLEPERILRVYDLTGQRVRLDSTTASGQLAGHRRWDCSSLGTVKMDGPTQPQVKVMLSALDPLGLPLTTQVVSGEKADDPLYIPAIEQVRQGMQKSGMLYVGDCKLMSLETRAFRPGRWQTSTWVRSRRSVCPTRPWKVLPGNRFGPVKQALTEYLAHIQADGQRVKRIAEGYERTEIHRNVSMV
jgi:hypothetical protein